VPSAPDTRGKSIKEIVRDLKVSRNTVRKVLRSGATAFSYEREVQPLPKLGRWRDELDRLLAANEAKSARERLTLIRLFEELRGLGYEGGYDAVRRYARGWRKERAAVSAASYVPLTFAPGEASSTRSYWHFEAAPYPWPTRRPFAHRSSRAASMPISTVPRRRGSAYAYVRSAALGARKQPFRFREEFRAPTGVRKSPKNEPAGHVRCAMGFLRSGWSSS
jgi:hypothetical protein